MRFKVVTGSLLQQLGCSAWGSALHQPIPHPDPPVLQKPPTPVPFGGEAAGPSFQTGCLTHGYPVSYPKSAMHHKVTAASLQSSSHRFHQDCAHTTLRRDSPNHNKALQARENHLLPLNHRLKGFMPIATTNTRGERS